MEPQVGRRDKPRYFVGVPGLLRTGRGQAQQVEITDLSETGCCFVETTNWLKIGSVVSIRIGSLESIGATIRWVREMRVGIEFHLPIYGPVFEHLCAVLKESKAQAERRSLGLGGYSNRSRRRSARPNITPERW